MPIREKNVAKVLDTNSTVFNHLITLDYDSFRGTNHKILQVRARDEFKLDTFENMRVVENYVKTVKKLQYFRKIIFCDIFPAVDNEWGDSEDALEVWHYRLREILKMQHIAKKERDLYVFFF